MSRKLQMQKRPKVNGIRFAAPPPDFDREALEKAQQEAIAAALASEVAR